MGLSILDHLPTPNSGWGPGVLEYGSRQWSKASSASLFGGLYEDCSHQETDFEPLLGIFVENDNCHT